MKKIAIVGAGISGLFFANLIEKNKYYSYKIFERKNSIDLNDGYGLQLSVNSIKMIHNKIICNRCSNITCVVCPLLQPDYSKILI